MPGRRGQMSDSRTGVASDRRGWTSGGLPPRERRRHRTRRTHRRSECMTFTTRPTLRGTFGMVSSTHWLASQSAMRILELGGNAFDAAVAAGFVLHVVEPHLNGPGGEVPAIVATAADPRRRVSGGRGARPRV